MTLDEKELFFSNYKCSARFENFQTKHFNAILAQYPQNSRRVNNFLVLKQNWVFIIFRTGFINITKITSESCKETLFTPLNKQTQK